jgi:hypothetical protein
VEYAHVERRFVIDESQRVRQSIQIHQTNYFQQLDEHNRMHDLLTNLKTDMLSDEQKDAFVTTVLIEDLPNWEPLLLTFTRCGQMMLRQDSTKKMRHVDAHLNSTHGPVHGNPLLRDMLAIVYMPLEHKEKQKAKRVIGAWRHCKWKQCFTGHYAMVLFYCLNLGMLCFNFRKENLAESPEWYNERIIPEWNNATTAERAYKVVYSMSGIQGWEKVTHMRKSGTEYASARGGLTPHLIVTMTKHKMQGLSKIDTAYMTELHPKVLLVMSETLCRQYFNPRCELQFKPEFNDDHADDHNGYEDIPKLVIPDIDVYKQQILDSPHDLGIAACYFVDKLLPFLARIVLQDGIYWVSKFPNHSVSQLLLAKLPASYS